MKPGYKPICLVINKAYSTRLIRDINHSSESHQQDRSIEGIVLQHIHNSWLQADFSEISIVHVHDTFF